MNQGCLQSANEVSTINESHENNYEYRAITIVFPLRHLIQVAHLLKVNIHLLKVNTKYNCTISEPFALNDGNDTI